MILGNAFQMTSNSVVLSKWLTLYVAETRKQDGHKYSPKTLYSLLMSLSPDCCTLDSNAPNFIMSMTLTGRHQRLLNTVDLLQTALHCAIIMLMFALLYCSVLGFCILSFGNWFYNTANWVNKSIFNYQRLYPDISISIWSFIHYQRLYRILSEICHKLWPERFVTWL